MDTVEKVKDIIADQLGLSAEEINLDSSIMEDLGADSLDMVELVMKLEEEFSLKIAEEDLQKIVTVEDAAKYIQAKV
jgi:acyl carrier protein